MAITRTAITDDDGSGTTGTVVNNAWKSELYDQMDAWVTAWTAVAYASGNFTATGGGTVTVDSGDQIVFRYFKTNRACTVDVVLNTFSITGTVNTINIASPVTAVNQAEVAGLIFDNSGSVASLARVFILGGGTTIAITKADATNFAASTNNSYLRFTLTFEW